jgi:hypothetical protein
MCRVICNCVNAPFFTHCETRWQWCCWQVTSNDSFLHLTDAVDRHIDSISKVNYALFCHVADIVNARYSYYCVFPTVQVMKLLLTFYISLLLLFSWLLFE